MYGSGRYGSVEVVQIVDSAHRADRGDTVLGLTSKVDAVVVEVIVEASGLAGGVVVDDVRSWWGRQPLLRLGAIGEM